MSKNFEEEQVLVFKRDLLDSLGNFQGINTDVNKYLPALLDTKNNFFIRRVQAEEDTSHKQIVSYCIIRSQNKTGKRYLHYTRGKTGGETRLHAQISIGIGGHINPVDAREDHLGMATYMASVEREIDEELKITGERSNKIIALLNDDSSMLGKVHLGIVHMVDLDNNKVSPNEAAIHNLNFATLDKLQGPLYERLETWSQHCVNALEKIEAPI